MPFLNILDVFSIFLILKQFSPLTHLLYPFLIETKNVSNKYIHQTLTPYFFCTSLLLIPTFYFIHIFFNIKTLCIFVMFSKFISLLIIAFYNKFVGRNDKMKSLVLKLTMILMAFYTSFFKNFKAMVFIMHDYVYKNRNNYAAAKTYNKLNFLKKVSILLSSLFGQALYNISDFEPIICLTLFSQSCAIIITLFLPSLKLSETTFKSLLNISEYKKIFTKEIIYLCLLVMLYNILEACLIFYRGNIFYERKQELSQNWKNAVRIISLPLNLFVHFYLKIYNLFFHAKIKKVEGDVLLFGYVDAFSKAAMLVFSIFYSKLFMAYFFIDKIEFKEKCAVNFLLFCILTSFFMLGKTKSIEKTYILEIILHSLVNTLNLTVYPILSNTIESQFKASVLILIDSCAALIHFFVSIFTSHLNYASQKIKIYFVIVSLLSLLIVLLGFLI